ncbi:WbqC family protein [Marinobacteraceae bacterium S3BR75-40.1]
MKVAVMQPYLFPYIGYFQLINAADVFIVYDDVDYINRGYINRNRILSPSGVIRFTVPVPGASQNKKISDLEFSPDVKKVVRAIEHSYAKAPFFEYVLPIVKNILENKERSIAALCIKSFEDIYNYLDIPQRIIKASELEYDRSADAKDRLIALTRKFEGDIYINAPGGRELYSKSYFKERNVELKFLRPLPVEYDQRKGEFVPNLSIIDVLMHCPPREVVRLLNQYELD